MELAASDAGEVAKVLGPIVTAATAAAGFLRLYWKQARELAGDYPVKIKELRDEMDAMEARYEARLLKVQEELERCRKRDIAWREWAIEMRQEGFTMPPPPVDDW